MTNKVSINYSATDKFIRPIEIDMMKMPVYTAKEQLISGSGQGSDYLGWIDLPINYDKKEFARIEKAAAKIKSDSEVLLVIGIGGSYLGARAAIEFLRHSFYNSEIGRAHV